MRPVRARRQLDAAREDGPDLTDIKPSDQITIVGTTDANGNVMATAFLAGGNALQGLFGGQGGPGGVRVASPSPTARP